MNPYAERTTLKPVYDKKRYHEELSKAIADYWYATIYAPVLAIVQAGKKNARESLLVKEINAGNIQYYKGCMVGKFNAKTSLILISLGGKWNKLKKGYEISLSQLPMDARQALAQSNVRKTETKKKIDQFLDEKSTEIGSTFDFRNYFARVIDDLNKQFRQTVSDKISVQEQVEEGIEEQLAQDYGQNLNLYINGWTEQAIFRLREKVSESVFDGFRSSALIETIKGENGVSQRKAKFLARQETSLLVSKYREFRYKDIGVTMYKWSTSHDERVRHNPKGGDHKILDQKIFRFDDPPVVDRATGRRANPGEDFNCRCVAIPILVEGQNV